MRNFKRFLAVALAMLMVCSAMIGVSAKSFPDVAKDDDYAVAIDVLSDLKIVLGGSDGKYNADATLTRWQMAVFASKLLSGKVDYDWTAGANETPFVDITDAYGMCAAAINYAYTKGLIKGTDATHYAPNDTITVQDAMTLLVRLLGYDSADMVYPNDFISLAAKLGLEDGLFFTNYKKAITRGEMAQMVYNTLFARRMSIVNPYISTIAEDVFGLAYGNAILAMTPSYILDSDDEILVEAREHGDLVGFYIDDEIAIYTVEQLQAAMGTDVDVDTLFGQAFTLVANANDNYKLYTAKASGADIFTEDDAKFEILTDKDNVATGKVKIDGTTYKVVTAYSNHNHAGNNYVKDNEIVILNANEGGSYPVMTKDAVHAAALATSAPKYYDLVAIDADADGKYDYAFFRTYQYGKYTITTKTVSNVAQTTYALGGTTLGTANRDLTKVAAISYAGNLTGVANNAYVIASYDDYYDTLTVRKTLDVQGPGYISHAGQKTITIDGKAYTIGTTGLAGAEYTTIYNKFYPQAVDNNLMVWAVGQSLEFVADGDALYEILDGTLTQGKYVKAMTFDTIALYEDIAAIIANGTVTTEQLTALLGFDFTKGVPVYAYYRSANVSTDRVLVNIAGVYLDGGYYEFTGSIQSFIVLASIIDEMLDTGDMFYFKKTNNGAYYITDIEEHDSTETTHKEAQGYNWSGSGANYTKRFFSDKPGTVTANAAGFLFFADSEGKSDMIFRPLFCVSYSSVLVYSEDLGMFFEHHGPLTNTTFTGVTYAYSYGVGTEADGAARFDFLYLYLGEGGTISNIANFAQFDTVYVGDTTKVEVFADGTVIYTDAYDLESGKKIEAGVIVKESYGKEKYGFENEVAVVAKGLYLVDANGYIVAEATETGFSSIYTDVTIESWIPYLENHMSAIATIENDGVVLANNTVFDNIKAYYVTDDGAILMKDGELRNLVTKFKQITHTADDTYSGADRSGGCSIAGYQNVYSKLDKFQDLNDINGDGNKAANIANYLKTTTFYVSGTTLIAISNADASNWF